MHTATQTARGAGLTVMLSLSAVALLAVMVVPIFAFAALFAVGAAVFGIASLGWLAVDGFRRRRVPAPVAAALAAPVAVSSHALPVRQVARPTRMVMVRVKRVEGRCPLNHEWHRDEMFAAGPDAWPQGLACPRAQRMIQAEADKMLAGTNGHVHTLRCLGNRHVVEFELQPAREVVHAA